jgi:hypothetical protein
LLVSCSATKIAKSIEANIPITDTALAASQIDTLTGAYATIDRDLFLYTGAFFEQKDSIAGGVIYQQETLEGYQLIIPKRIFRVNKKGKRIQDKNKNFVSDPFWVEIGNCVPSPYGESTYENIPIIIDDGNGTKDTFIFIPNPVETNQANSTGNISLRGTVQQDRTATSNDNINYRYSLSLLVCGSQCDQQKIYDNGFLIEKGSQRIFMIYKGTKYYVTLSKNKKEWYVPVHSSGVSLEGIYLEQKIYDLRREGLGKSKKIGKP